MKTIVFIITLAAFLTISNTIIGCNSPEKKVEEAQMDVQTAKKDLKNVQIDANIEAQKIAKAEEWKAFKTEAQLRINENENRISEFKARIAKSGKTLGAQYQKDVEYFEQKNRDLKMKVENYEKKNSDWESFKREYSHDMDELGTALKAFTVNNKR